MYVLAYEVAAGNTVLVTTGALKASGEMCLTYGELTSGAYGLAMLFVISGGANNGECAYDNGACAYDTGACAYETGACAYDTGACAYDNDGKAKP